MPIKNYEGFYEVSDKGRVRSLDRYVNGKHKNKAFRKGRVLKLEKIQNGYHRVELQKMDPKKDCLFIDWWLGHLYLTHTINLM